MDNNGEKINLELKDHQESLADMEKKDLQKLHTWAERFNSEFKLELSVPALMVDRLRSTQDGYFQFGRNGFGLLNEIAINSLYISTTEYWRVLATLVHELGHAVEQKTGTYSKSKHNNYHKKPYRDWAKSIGLTVDHAGHTRVNPPPSPFFDVLKKFGVNPPDIIKPEPVIVTKQGESKLKLWVCSCQPKPIKVRVAVSDFRAQCLKCGELFKPSQPVQIQPIEGVANV